MNYKDITLVMLKMHFQHMW